MIQWFISHTLFSEMNKRHIKLFNREYKYWYRYLFIEETISCYCGIKPVNALVNKILLKIPFTTFGYKLYDLMVKNEEVSNQFLLSCL